MAFNREFEINESQLEEFLANATERVRTSENVDLLSDLNKLFKKNVPLTVRKYVIAYLNATSVTTALNAMKEISVTARKEISARNAQNVLRLLLKQQKLLQLKKSAHATRA